MPITLMPHNIEAYGKVNEDIEKNNKTAVIQPTGTGKMYIGLKYVEDNKEKKAIYIAPSNAILHDVKKNIFAEGMTMQDFPNLKRITYQKLVTLSDEEIEKLEADIIIVDEFHHCGAPVWGKGVERLIERNPNAKILGFSATPIRYNDGLRDMADEMFENNVASEMTLEEAIDRGILPGATYVSTLYSYEQLLLKHLFLLQYLQHIFFLHLYHNISLVLFFDFRIIQYYRKIQFYSTALKQHLDCILFLLEPPEQRL